MNKRIICTLLTLAMSISNIFIVSAEDSAVQIYVSENGSDMGNGTVSSPYKTIEMAIKSVTHYNNQNKKSEVVLSGDFRVDDIIKIENIENVIFKSDKTNRATIRGNIVLDSIEAPDSSDEILAKIPETVRDNIKQIKLNGILDKDEIIAQYTHTKANEFLYSDILLFSGDEMMERAKWPNDDYAVFDKVYDGGTTEGNGDAVTKGFTIGYDDARIDSWSGNNIWAEGFGVYLWVYDKVKIDTIDKINKKITSVPAVFYTGMAEGAELRFLNVIEELDAPGEWYFDEISKNLYYYPIDNSSLELTTRIESLLEITNSKNVTFDGIDFKGTRGDGIVVDNSENVVFTNCTVSQIGRVGIDLKNNKNSGIMNSAVFDCGQGGITLSGGVKENLENGNNFVENCVITRFSQVVPVSSPAIHMSGVGNYAKNNTIFDAWQIAVIIQGNNNKLIRNEIFDVVMGSEDASAIYSYADSSSRGIEIRENYIHHLGVGTEKASRMGVSAIYLDGWTSSRIIENNIFYDCVAGINLNGGDENTVRNNIFIDTPVSVWAQTSDLNAIVYWGHLKNKYLDWEVWKKEYPEITDYEVNNYYNNDGASIMKNITIENNLLYNSSHTSSELSGLDNSGVISNKNNRALSKADFVGYDDLNFALTDEFYQLNSDIQKINFDKIGANITIDKNDDLTLLSKKPVVQYNMEEIISGQTTDRVGENSLMVPYAELKTTADSEKQKKYIYSQNASFTFENDTDIKNIIGQKTFEVWVKGNISFNDDKVTINYNTEKWTHFVCVYNEDSVTADFYVDGVKTTGSIAAKISTAVTINGNDLSVGKVAIYDYPLSEIEIARLYRSEREYYTLKTFSILVDYNMKKVEGQDSKEFVKNNASVKYPLLVGPYGSIVSKNNSGIFEENRALYSSKGLYSVDDSTFADAFNGEISVNMWIKPTKAEIVPIINVTENNNDGPFVIRYTLGSDNNKFRIDVRRKFSTEQGYWLSDSYETGKWYNVFIRYSDKSADNVPEIFVNGVKSGLQEVKKPIGEAVTISDNMKVLINGQNAESTSSTYYGDIEIYDSIVPETRIYACYSKTKKSYELDWYVHLFDKNNIAIGDYTKVNPTGLQILSDTENVSLFSLSDNSYIEINPISYDDTRFLINTMALEGGKTYKLINGKNEIEFTTVNE